MWEIQARYSDYALQLISSKTDPRVLPLRKAGIFHNWTSVSDMGELEDLIEKYDKGIRKDVRLYQYRLYNAMTDEAIPCEIL